MVLIRIKHEYSNRREDITQVRFVFLTRGYNINTSLINQINFFYDDEISSPEDLKNKYSYHSIIENAQYKGVLMNESQLRGLQDEYAEWCYKMLKQRQSAE